MYLSIDEASTHVGVRYFRLLTGKKPRESYLPASASTQQIHRQHVHIRCCKSRGARQLVAIAHTCSKNQKHTQRAQPKNPCGGAGVYTNDGEILLGTSVSNQIRVLANNDVPTGAAFIPLVVPIACEARSSVHR